MSRLAFAWMLLVSTAASAQAPSELTRRFLLEVVAPGMCNGFITAGAGHQFPFTGVRFYFKGDIVQPAGEVRADQLVSCDRGSFVIRDVRAAAIQSYPADGAVCGAIVTYLAKDTSCPSH